MKNRSIIFLLLLPVVFAGSLNAQSVSEFERLAAEQNPELRALLLEYEAALEKSEQVTVWQGPQVAAGIPVLPVETRLGTQRLTVGASQMFPWFGLKEAQEDVYISMSKERYERVSARQLEITYSIRNAYYSLYEIREQQRILDKNIELFGSLERIALSKVESGKSNLSDVLRVQMKREELLSRKDILDNRRSIHESTINALSGRPVETPVSVMDSFELAVLPIDRETLAATVRESHPELKRLDWMMAASEDRIAANNKSGMPSFGFGLEYALITPLDNVSPANNGRDVLIPKIMASIPLQRKQFDARNREESLAREALEVRREGMADIFESQLEALYSEYREAILEAELVIRQRVLASSAVEILLSAYSAEGRQFDELLQLENELLNLEMRLIKAVVTTHRSKAGVDRLSGMESKL